jgi:hypothetical protein
MTRKVVTGGNEKESLGVVRAYGASIQPALVAAPSISWISSDAPISPRNGRHIFTLVQNKFFELLREGHSCPPAAAPSE